MWRGWFSIARNTWGGGGLRWGGGGGGGGEPVAVGAIRLGGAWRVREAVDELTKIARNENRSSAVRQASIESLCQIGSGKDVLAELAGNAKSDAVRVAAIRA